MYNPGKKTPDGSRYVIEDTRSTRCQCIMDHHSLIEGGIWQCREARCLDSNLFCRLCENTHGAYWRKKHPA
jgi:hypothetical protein